MRFSLTPEQEAFRETARRFLSDRVRVRDAIELPGAHDLELWKSIAAMGWLGVDVPEEYGGQGLTFVETALLAEEAGRALLPGPFTGALQFTAAITTAGTSQQRAELLPVACSGESVVAAHLDAAPIRFVRNRLRGEVAAVACGEAADRFVVLAESPSGPALVVVKASEAAIEPVESADLTRPAAWVRFDGARVEATLDGVRLDEARDRARVLVAADAVGGATRALEMAVAYAKDRVQFDRPIGSFQAVKHRAADAYRALEAARLATWYAAWSIANGAAGASTAACAAKAMAGDAFVRCAADSIQIHGGIGFTWEHDAHLYYRRALADQATLGDATAQREAIAAGVLAGA